MQHKTFTDFDEFRATNAQLDGQWLINGGRDWRWTTESLAVGDCQMLRCFSQTGLIIEGVESQRAYHFYVPFKRGVWRNNGLVFNEDEILIMEPGAEQCETSKTPDGWHGFIVPKHLVAIKPETRGERARTSYTVKTERQRTDAVRGLFQRFIAAAAKNPDLESSPAARMVEAELRSLLEPVLGCDEAPNVVPGRRPASRIEIAQRSKAVLEKCANEPIHVSQLASLVGVSSRTLQTAFNEYYQIGPRQYLRLRQLHQVRHDLLCADPDETTVTEIMIRRGVWELGRFSGRYKLQFGELPRETLRRRPLTRPFLKDER
jgi:AraC-like DNA-binding protein